MQTLIAADELVRETQPGHQRPLLYVQLHVKWRDECVFCVCERD